MDMMRLENVFMSKEKREKAFIPTMPRISSFPEEICWRKKKIVHRLIYGMEKWQEK